MMNEETYLEQRVGKGNPFRVPDGYFDSLTAQVMARVDEQGRWPERKARTVWLRPVYYAAASVCALLVCGAAWMWSARQLETAPSGQTVAHQVEDRSFDQAADYVMVDNMDIYACLSSDY